MLESFNYLLTFYVIFPTLICLGIYLSLRLKFLQCFRFTTGLKYLFKDELEAKGNLSHLQAIASVLAGNFGTGNIAGMAVALTTGGPGALVWMWIMAFFGSIIQYASCLLGVKYRVQNARGEYVGGPMYYLSQGLNFKFLAILFAVAVLFSAMGVGVFAQMNSITLAFEPFGVSNVWIIALLLLATAGVVLGGAKHVAYVSTAIIPIMAFLYLGSSIFILAKHIQQLPAVFVLLFKAALSPSAIVGGSFGYTFLQVISTGLGRALFATDVGTGYVPILQAGAKSRNAVVDGMVALVAPLLVMIVCTVTALVLLVTGAYDTGLKSAQMVLFAFKQEMGQQTGQLIVSVALLLFGYTTLIAWGCCFERAAGYLFKDRYRRVFQLVFLACIPMSHFLSVDSVWIFADASLTCMTLCNLIGVIGLSKQVVGDSRLYLQS